MTDFIEFHQLHFLLQSEILLYLSHPLRHILLGVSNLNTHLGIFICFTSDWTFASYLSIDQIDVVEVFWIEVVLRAPGFGFDQNFIHTLILTCSGLDGSLRIDLDVFAREHDFGGIGENFYVFDRETFYFHDNLLAIVSDSLWINGLLFHTLGGSINKLLAKRIDLEIVL